MVIILENATFRKFKCYRCGTVFQASHPEVGKTKTGFNCNCPTCGYACYTHN